MDVDSSVELVALHRLVEEADIAESSRQAVGWCLKQLPRLYRELARTSESRYADEISRLARAMLKELAGAAPAVAEGVVTQLRALHARWGLPGLDLKRKAS